MRVKCVLCDKLEKIEDGSPLAKRLRNRPIHTYMCADCNKRIADRTEERKASGNFSTFRQAVQEDTW
ncbi:YlaI family protein [Pseudalkalibacillus decolorationis]|uniref:YlaI family protein n=1 Tax=Pseudalkalibacillus decolorationis TaxID=163879 RepID=UPI0021481468|nr:YlaI family protein [Pseudalkalibacillus decolorationis]